MGGLWSLNVVEEENKTDTFPGLSRYSKIIEIVKFGENAVQITNRDKTYNIKYGEEADVPSNSNISDGINYFYTIKIIKK